MRYRVEFGKRACAHTHVNIYEILINKIKYEEGNVRNMLHKLEFSYLFFMLLALFFVTCFAAM